jgi:adenylyl-sulfate kinase
MSDARRSFLKGTGHVFWLFGLSGAGKTTLARGLQHELLADAGREVLMLDGDRLRFGLCRDLKFSQEDRMENLRRAAEVAKLGLESGLSVVAAFITPLEIHRCSVQEIIGANAISMIFVHAPLAVCQQRDVKGLYAKANSGSIHNMTGLGSAFEPPLNPALTVRTEVDLPATSLSQLTNYARQVRQRTVAV